MTIKNNMKQVILFVIVKQQQQQNQHILTFNFKKKSLYYKLSF